MFDSSDFILSGFAGIGVVSKGNADDNPVARI
jgi:hypothetical protein